MTTQLIGYKFFKKGHCEIIGDSVRDSRGFIFESNKEIGVDNAKWTDDKSLKEIGIVFNCIPQNNYQFFPILDLQEEDIVFEVATIGYWFNDKPYSQTIIYSERVKVIRKLTRAEFNEISKNIYGKFGNEGKKNSFSVIGKTIKSLYRMTHPNARPNDIRYVKIMFTDNTHCFFIAQTLGQADAPIQINMCEDDLSELQEIDMPFSEFTSLKTPIDKDNY